MKSKLKYFYGLVLMVFTCVLFFAHVLSPVTLKGTEAGGGPGGGDEVAIKKALHGEQQQKRDPKAIVDPSGSVAAEAESPSSLEVTNKKSDNNKIKQKDKSKSDQKAVNKTSNNDKKPPSDKDSVKEAVKAADKEAGSPPRPKEDPYATKKPAVRKKVKLTYDSPERYKGPFVEGWPPKKNRHMPDYIRPQSDTFPVRPWRSHTKGASLLVVVHSTLTSFDARQGIRDTWGTYVSDPSYGIRNVSIIFLVGNDNAFHNLTNVIK